MMKPLFNPTDDPWVWAVGRYMLNMGAVEAATRLLVAEIEGSTSSPVYSDDLSARLGFIRKRFPRQPVERHASAMKVFAVVARHCGFRNIVAHCPLVMSEKEDGTYEIHGILSITSKPCGKVGDLVSLEELTGRVDEAAKVAEQMLNMQGAFKTV